MKALVCKEYGPPENLVIEEKPDPIPGDGEVLVDIKAAGINFPDVLVIAGTYQVKVPHPSSRATRQPVLSRRSVRTSAGSNRETA